jgi:hypothetical protein
VHVVFPIFVVSTLAGDEASDTSFSNADQTFTRGQTASLDPGMLLLTGWQPTDRMRIEFTKLEGVIASGGTDGGTGPGPTGGCKSVSSFAANAVPAIRANTCLNCHDTGGSGNGALDLSALNAQPEDDTTACAQALRRADPTNPPQSDVIRAPTGGVANHPFQNASASFVLAMETWIGNER